MTVRKAPANELAPQAGAWFRVHGLLKSSVLVGTVSAALIGVLINARVETLPSLGLWTLACALVLVWQVAIKPAYLVRSWRYEISEQEVYLQRGIFVIRRTVIPILRIENVDTAQGPLARRYDVMSVSVSTAAGKHEIPALQSGVAEALRDHIAQLAREARDA
ncbi:MAG: PH domain-containing protein [Myxococcota bacterium]